MSVELRVSPDTREDILQAERYFESRQTGLGNDFVDETLRLFDRMAEMPFMYGEVDEGIRAVALARFGYVAYYRIDEAGIEVLAVLHGARSPEAWQRRL